jgi:hypothetical protein
MIALIFGRAPKNGFENCITGEEQKGKLGEERRIYI